MLSHNLAVPGTYAFGDWYGLVIETLILVAVVAEGYISWKHYQLSLTKKQRGQLNQKIGRLLSYGRGAR